MPDGSEQDIDDLVRAELADMSRVYRELVSMLESVGPQLMAGFDATDSVGLDRLASYIRELMRDREGHPQLVRLLESLEGWLSHHDRTEDDFESSSPFFLALYNGLSWESQDVAVAMMRQFPEGLRAEAVEYLQTMDWADSLIRNADLSS